VVGESLAGRRDAADAVVVGEAEGPAAADQAVFPSQRFRMHQVLRGDVAAEDAAVNARVDRPVEGTAILFGKKAGAAGEAKPALRRLDWSAVAADEMLLGYVVAAPGIRAPAARRLEWFIARLEHPEPAIAEDAFTECGLAPFEAVRSAAAAFDAAKLRQWVGEPAIDQRRRGFYGLALGLVAATAADPAEARACVAALHAAIEAPADDFRAGVDGLMAGILVAAGDSSGRPGRRKYRRLPGRGRWTNGIFCRPCASRGKVWARRSPGTASPPRRPGCWRVRSWRQTRPSILPGTGTGTPSIALPDSGTRWAVTTRPCGGRWRDFWPRVHFRPPGGISTASAPRSPTCSTAPCGRRRCRGESLHYAVVSRSAGAARATSPGRLLRPSWPPLAPCRLHFALRAALAGTGRLHRTGSPSSRSYRKTAWQEATRSTSNGRLPRKNGTRPYFSCSR
jgi:hypothetical protein